jgi:hypothetical protein
MQKRNHGCQWFFWRWMRGLFLLPVLLSPTVVVGHGASQWCSPPYLVEWPDTHPVWSFCWTPPADSSGIYGSGIEISHAFYKGQRVFWNAHIPIQRVNYVGDACGPYRDWHNQEHLFECSGTPVGKACFGAAKTICDGLPDGSGNFTGVVIDKRVDEVVLISAMAAGWYRYVQEWHFRKDGTIEPRFLMTGSAIPPSCTVDHTHHVYWRFDFDIDGAPNDAVQEAFLFPDLWRTLTIETSRVKDPSFLRMWRVLDRSTRSRWTIIPGPTDGVADTFSKADLWALRYHAGELSDNADALDDKLNQYVTGEGINREDVVTWYVGHGFHKAGDAACHVVGPDLRR